MRYGVQLGAIVLHLSLLTSACFSPDYQENLACTASGACPGDLQCVEERCVSTTPKNQLDSGTSPDGDPSVVDASPDEPDGDTAADAAPCTGGELTIAATEAIVDFVVPDCIDSLSIEVFGAEGGGSPGNALLGGKGARMKGNFAVSGGDILKVLVGSKGIDDATATGQGGGTGGGGSFVIAPDGAAMIAAGGGGGSSRSATSSLPGGDARTTANGQAGGNNANSGGTAGAGGVANPNTGYQGGTGGGGFLTGGVNESAGDTLRFGTNNKPGSSYLSGGAGGIGGSQGRDGGFGGGGAAGYTGGGGGGYSGGGAAGKLANAATYGAGGGGSINVGTEPDNTAGAKSGDGQVIIIWAPPL